MITKYFVQFLHSFRKKLTFIQGGAHIGSSGVTSLPTGTGWVTLTRDATAGLYKLTLMDAYTRVLNASIIFDEGVSASTGVYQVNLVSAETNIPSKVVYFQCRDASGAAVDPTSGSTIYFNLWLDNTKVLPSNEV